MQDDNIEKHDRLDEPTTTTTTPPATPPSAPPDPPESPSATELSDPVTPQPEREYPVDRIRRRFERNLGGRPLMVYFVLFAGAAVLLVLLVIVWISATGDKTEQPPPCFDITVAEAQSAIRDSAVERVEIFLDRDRPELGPSVIRFSMTDGSCRELPKGADNIDQAYVIIGFVEVYNSTHEERVRVAYRRTNVLPELLVTSTPTPTITSTPLPTETPTPTPEPTETPSPTATVAPSPSPTIDPAEDASPVASEGTPVTENGL